VALRRAARGSRHRVGGLRHIARPSAVALTLTNAGSGRRGGCAGHAKPRKSFFWGVAPGEVWTPVTLVGESAPLSTTEAVERARRFSVADWTSAHPTQPPSS